jgi:hypothetical protein
LTTVHAPASERGLGIPHPVYTDDARMVLQEARERAKRKLRRPRVILAALDGDEVVVKARVGSRVETERWRV